MSQEPEIFDEEDVIAPATEEETNAFQEKLDLIAARCHAAELEFDRSKTEDGSSYGIIFFPNGKTKRVRRIFNEDTAESFLSINFEKYTFLSGYEAICCYHDGYIEAGIRSAGSMISPKYFLRRIQGQAFSSSSDTETTSIELAPSASLPGRPVIELGPSSDEFFALSRGPAARMSIKLRGIRATQHDQAVAEMRSYTDSLFFQIDAIFNGTFLLERERRPRALLQRHTRPSIDLTYPVALYNSEAISLFWYAKSARDMPLLRFLAFYQSIEFFFPRYSQIEVRRRVASVVKDPMFRPHRDDDVDRIISAIQPSKGSGLGSERAQLRAVVNECLGTDEVRQYLTSDEGQQKYFSAKGPKYHKIPLANESADLRNDVADRIYDIRCKIVHTKNDHSDGEAPMILPFSEDAEYLIYDIDLIEFVARSVLVASSGELS